MQKQASIEEAREQLVDLIAAASAGDEVIITDNGRPVAKLSPVVEARTETDAEWLERMERKGFLRRGKVPPRPLPPPPPLPDGRTSSGVLDALLEERRKGR